MKKVLLIIISVIVTAVILVAINLKTAKSKLMSYLSNAFVKSNVELQYDKEKTTSSKNKLNFEQFKDSLEKMSNARYEEIDNLVKNATVKDIENLYNEKKMTCEELVTYYLNKIEKYDVNKLNTIIELNPDAIKLAKEKDSGNKQGKLYGIPVLLKDNIGTGDKMHNTSGAYALKDSILTEDSFVAAKLKAAGAIILGKANLSEWANYMTSKSANGYSALGGQTHNPYGKFDVGGSSSGSAAAVAANFAPIAIGSETAGSMIYPSGQNSVVGIKPTLGLVSRDKIIPIVEAQDTAGVISKHVEDTALVLEVISGSDEKDVDTQDADKHKEDYTKYLNDTSLKGKKVAIVQINGPREEDKGVLQRVEKELKNMGAIITKKSFNTDDIAKIKMNDALRIGFKFDVNKYLQSAKVPGINNLKDVVEFNKKDLANRAPYGQDLLEKSLEDTTSVDEYNKIIENNRKVSRGLIDNILKDADVIVSLSNYTSGVYAPAGYPAVTVPAGYKTTGEPVGVTFVASRFQEGKLINVASIYEKNTKHRKDPAIH